MLEIMNCVCELTDRVETHKLGIHRRREYRHCCRHGVHIQVNPSVCRYISMFSLCYTQQPSCTHAHVNMDRYNSE